MSEMAIIDADEAREFSEAQAQIGEGWWRLNSWAFRQRIPEALGITRREWGEQYHRYLKLPPPERREAVAELAASGMNNSQIADALGVTETTVRRDLSPDSTNVEPESEVHSEPQVLPPYVGEPSTNVEPEPEAHMPAGQDQADAILADIDQQVAEASQPEPEPSPAQLNDGDEWYTPQWLFDALGIKFALDVCAPPDLTYTSVPADRHFTVEDDGLAQPWDGTVWCNPPYSKPEPWARRMIHHRDGLFLCHMPMNAGWCVDMWEVCDAIRLFQAMEFVRPDGTSQRPGYWLQLAAFGPVATEALARLQPLGQAAANKRRVASPMWRRAA